MYRSFNRSPARKWQARNTQNHALVHAIYETQLSNSPPIERPSSAELQRAVDVQYGANHIQAAFVPALVALKAIGDGDGQHCHRCNDKKQPKAYDQPKAV
jgi:hypothetical protein